MEQLSFDIDEAGNAKAKPISVKELNLYVKDLLDRDDFLNNVYVKGEISNYKRHYTGHLYFTLKDKDAAVKCVMFKSYTSTLDFEPEDGMQVVILGTCGVYERDGVYQIYVKAISQDGLGNLYKEFEKLKEELAKKGLFDEENKKPIPLLPKSIGVVTSSTGSVIKDIINVTTRRFPKVNIKLFPAQVQGSGAADTICEGIKYFNKEKNVDVIIVARGGGSLEDLWPFNEEKTAYAIYESELPVISAVGHETDFTIADFVADLRAPTPSAAGELAVPELDEVLWKIENFKRRLKTALVKETSNFRVKLDSLMQSKPFSNPLSMLETRILRLEGLNKHIENNVKLGIKNKKIKLVEKIATLDGLSPLKILSRGYSMVLDENDNIVKSKKALKKDDKIKITMHDGDVEAKVL